MIRDSKRGSRLGFTIVELLVVLGIMAILAAIVAPSWEEYRSRMKVAEVANVFCTAFRDARDAALLEQGQMRIDIDNADSKIVISRIYNNRAFSVYREYKFSNEVYLSGTSTASIDIGRGGYITDVNTVSTKTSTIGSFSITVFDVTCAAKATQAVDHVFITSDGRVSVGAE